jgi:hypothetical protein
MALTETQKRGATPGSSSHYSDSPFLRQPIITTAHFSDNPLFRQPFTPTMTNIYINFVIFLNKWSNEFDIDEIEWGITFSESFSLSKNNKLSCFQYELIHRVLALNPYLFKCKITETELYSFCNEAKEPIITTVHFSDNPLLRQPISPTTHYSDSPLLRQ